MNLKIQQLDVLVETKTKDDVFVKIKVSVQFRIIEDKVYEAFYELDDPHGQIASYIFDEVRAEVPKLGLDDVFGKKDDIALAVRDNISSQMGQYGYKIVKTLITDINPDELVKASMNKINAATRDKEAAFQEAEAEKIRIVKRAEAEADSKRLSGEGIAQQRLEIVRGFKESVEDFNKITITMVLNVVKNITVIRDGEEVTFVIPEGSHNKLLSHKSKLFELRIPFIAEKFTEISPAKSAGMIKGDQIVGLNGQSIIYYTDFREEIQNYKIKVSDIKLLAEKVLGIEVLTENVKF